MNERTVREKTHSSIHFIALAGTAVGLTFSKAVMSMALLLGILNLLAQAEFKSYFAQLRSNRFFHLIALLFLLHGIGMLWSHDVNYGLNDLRIKLPLIVLPVLLFSQAPSQHHINLLLNLFCAGVLATTLFNYMAYDGLVGNYQYDDIRGMSLFGSHIRFSLLVSMAALINLYFLYTSARFKALNLLLFIWFAYYTYFSQIISGNFALLVGILAFLFFLVFGKNKKAAITFIALAIAIPLLILGYFLFVPKNTEQVEYKNLPKFTKEGNPYSHDLVEHRDTEGNLLYINVCDDELKREWAKISSFSYDGEDLKKQPIRTTLIRYLTSKGLKKDAEGIRQLNAQDISNIERGIAEAADGRRGLIARFNGIKYQLQHSSDPNGHSLLQRLEHWKTGWRIVRSNWIFGVGTGDVQEAFDQQYAADKSLLSAENRNRTHNQFLTFWISFGILGFGLFLYLIWNYLSTTLYNKQLLGFVFMVLVCSSFLLEDTLETQTGVTFFAFFYSLFALQKDSVTPRT
jgi:hypothetical protein